MDLKTLKTFQAIVENGSFARAAEAMNYAQSTVTMQIQRLEAELGVSLLERGRQLELTEAGRLFHEQIRGIVQQIEKLQLYMGEIGTGSAGSVRLGVTEPTGSLRLPALLQEFREEAPGIILSLEFGSTPQLAERMLQGEIDLALCSAPGFTDRLDFDILFQERFILLIPEGHTLSSRNVAVPADLASHRLLVTSSTCPYRRKLELVLQEAGVAAVDMIEVGSMAALPHYVQAGHGIALVPEIMVSPVPAGTAALSLEGALIGMECGLLRAPDRPLSQAVTRLYRYLQNKLAGQVNNGMLYG
ncbi:LysR family transcriptional regulator [Paenibacillus sp. JX-17]|uniref:LysR family transcriptional regulator n=1 Tax=Paenibacillus lacisoli TaxID=3064525 RepID=A0ABT9CDB4_9BACL|nr:LysR family transcriptional regulator [Paenibacillus sp. JX-17]MDO7905967.1 LysR family transcriptional regulator [Paenibacillus sp. JX-17]